MRIGETYVRAATPDLKDVENCEVSWDGATVKALMESGCFYVLRKQSKPKTESQPVVVDVSSDEHETEGVSPTRAALIPGIGIAPIPAIFDGIGIGQVSYTSTNSVDCTLLTMKYFLLKSSS